MSRMATVVLLASVGGISCGADTLPPGMFDPASPLAGRIREFEGEGLGFRVPEGYLGPIGKAWKFDGTLRLYVLWPGLEPRHAGNDAEFKAPGGGRKISITIDFFKDRSRRAGFLNRLRGDGEYYLGWSDSPGRFSEMNPADDLYGLNRRVIDIEKLKAFLRGHNPSRISGEDIDVFELSRWEDLYFLENKEGDVNVLIKCSTEKSLDPDESLLNGKNIVPVPYCYHDFKFDKYNMSISMIYRRNIVKNWSEMQLLTKNLIETFIRN